MYTLCTVGWKLPDIAPYIMSYWNKYHSIRATITHQDWEKNGHESKFADLFKRSYIYIHKNAFERPYSSVGSPPSKNIYVMNIDRF